MAVRVPSWARRRRPVTLSRTSLQHVLLLCLGSLYFQASVALASWSFLPQKRFRYQGLITAGSLGLDDSGSGIVAWADWNGDQYLDALTLSTDRKTVYVHLWDHEAFGYYPLPLFSVSASNGQAIVNVVPADFNHDGHLDILLMTQRDDGTTIDMELWLGQSTSAGLIDSKPLAVPSSGAAQPMLVDGTGDMQLDLLGQPTNGSSSGTLKMWQNTLVASNGTKTFEITDGPFLPNDDGTQETPCELADPHSSAFIDLDGDCLADLFLVCAGSSQGRSRYQIWTAVKPQKGSKKGKADKPGGFVFSRSGLLPAGAGPLAFADMNRDGTTDIIFATCDSSDCYVNVVYNRQVELCEKRATAAGSAAEKASKSWWDWWSSGSSMREADPVRPDDRCRRTENLCVADDEFAIDFDGKSGSPSRLQVPFSLLGLAGHRPLSEDTLTSSKAKQPIPLAVGDFDKNGYPDLLLLSIPHGEDRRGGGKTSINILRNVRCSLLPSNSKAKAACQRGSSGADEGRWFAAVREGVEALDRIDDARTASWVDVDEDGSLDLMILRGGKDSRGRRTVTFVQNNFFHDAFFLKALTLNGACASYCEAASAASGQRYRPWGASLPGASYKFTVLDPNGNRRAQQVGQSPQSSYRPLLTPYSYFGLGRTNNYVENLMVGSTLHARRHVLAMEGVIPNSQVVISPFLDKGGNLDDVDPSTWRRELYLKPGDWIPWVALTLVTLIVGLCGFVFAMHVSEKREDERERKRAVHAINFDALG